MNYLIILSVITVTHVTLALPVNDVELTLRVKRDVNTNDHYRVVCYYVNWSQYRVEAGRYRVQDIDPNLCTHIMYAFAKIQGNDLSIYEYNDVTMYSQLQDLKKVNPSLRTLLSVGGATSFQAFRVVASSVNNRAEFARNVVKYVRQYGFDGIDIDWEFPTGGDRSAFTELIKKIRSQVESEAASTGRRPLLITCALGAAQNVINNAYDLETLHQYLDFATLMTYDLHGGWDKVTGFQAALIGYSSYDVFNQKWVVEKYLSLRFPSKKLLLGIPTYGRTFTLCSTSHHKVRDCSRGVGLPGPYTKSAGILAYNEICQNIKAGWTKVRDNIQQYPYAYNGDQWVGFDDGSTVKDKINFVRDQSLGGVMFWDLSMDDFAGRCNDGKHPLISVASSLIDKPNYTGLTSTPTQSTRTSTATTSSITPSTTSSQSTTMLSTRQSTTQRSISTSTAPSTTPSVTRTSTSTGPSKSTPSPPQVTTTLKTTTKPTTATRQPTTRSPTTRITERPKPTRQTSTITTRNKVSTTGTLSPTTTTTFKVSPPTGTSSRPQITTTTTPMIQTPKLTQSSTVRTILPTTTRYTAGADPLLPVTCPDLFSFLEDPYSCSVFYRCVWGRPVRFYCPRGTYFNLKLPGCDWPWAVKRSCPSGGS